MKRLYILLIHLLLVFITKSNLTAQETISAAGNYAAGNSSTMSWTIGENIVETFEGSNNTLTQGFQQSNLMVTSLSKFEDVEFTIKIYPNPIQDILNLKIEEIDSDKRFSYSLCNSNGNIIKTKKIANLDTRIYFTDLKPSVYILRIYNKNIEVEAFKIIKN